MVTVITRFDQDDKKEKVFKGLFDEKAVRDYFKAVAKTEYKGALEDLVFNFSPNLKYVVVTIALKSGRKESQIYKIIQKEEA